VSWLFRHGTTVREKVPPAPTKVNGTKPGSDGGNGNQPGNSANILQGTSRLLRDLGKPATPTASAPTSTAAGSGGGGGGAGGNGGPPFPGPRPELPPAQTSAAGPTSGGNVTETTQPATSTGSGNIGQGGGSGGTPTGSGCVPAAGSGPIHHIATNKNTASTARGGPWTPRFQELFDEAGMSLNDPANLVAVAGHHGPHPMEYHQTVYDRLTQATEGLSGAEYEQALRAELASIAQDAQTPGTDINNLLTGRGC
jgi:hypothetical protein